MSFCQYMADAAMLTCSPLNEVCTSCLPWSCIRWCRPSWRCHRTPPSGGAWTRSRTTGGSSPRSRGGSRSEGKGERAGTMSGVYSTVFDSAGTARQKAAREYLRRRVSDISKLIWLWPTPVYYQRTYVVGFETEDHFWLCVNMFFPSLLFLCTVVTSCFPSIHHPFPEEGTGWRGGGNLTLHHCCRSPCSTHPVVVDDLLHHHHLWETAEKDGEKWRLHAGMDGEVPCLQ